MSNPNDLMPDLDSLLEETTTPGYDPKEVYERALAELRAVPNPPFDLKMTQLSNEQLAEVLHQFSAYLAFLEEKIGRWSALKHAYEHDLEVTSARLYLAFRQEKMTEKEREARIRQDDLHRSIEQSLARYRAYLAIALGRRKAYLHLLEATKNEALRRNMALKYGVE